VERTVREVNRRVRVVASSYRAIDRSVTRWIVVTMVEWSSDVRWAFGGKMGVRRCYPAGQTWTIVVACTIVYGGIWVINV